MVGEGTHVGERVEEGVRHALHKVGDHRGCLWRGVAAKGVEAAWQAAVAEEAPEVVKVRSGAFESTKSRTVLGVEDTAAGAVAPAVGPAVPALMNWARAFA